LRAVQVLGRNGGRHVRSLTGGLVARGVEVTVCGPARMAAAYGFRDCGARFSPVEIADRARPRAEALAVTALRSVCAGVDVVHAHGLHAAALASLALTGPRPGGTPALVVTWHAAPPARGTRAGLLKLVERRIARASAVVLGASSTVVDHVRALGARDARLAPVACPSTSGGEPAAPAGRSSKTRAELGAVDRPLIVVAGRLEPHKGHDLLLDAARAWRGREPRPAVVVAGEGSARLALQRRIDVEDLPVRLLGGRDDVPELLAAADLVVLPSRFESYPVVVHQALRAGTPLVATAVGPVPELVGDAAVLVPPEDARALAREVDRLLDELADPGHRDRLAAAAVSQAATWPSEDDTVAQILSVYDELAAR
jgi:glycosyltransferase involved in cell wall biosynthesis